MIGDGELAVAPALALRAPRATDADALAAMLAPESSRLFTPMAEAPDPQAVRDWIARASTGDLRRSWIVTAVGAPDRAIGLLQAEAGADGVELHFLVCATHRRQGVMTGALRRYFAECAPARVTTAVVDLAHLAARRALERAGFTLAARLPRHRRHPLLGPTPRDCALYRCVAAVTRARSPAPFASDANGF